NGLIFRKVNNTLAPTGKPPATLLALPDYLTPIVALTIKLHSRVRQHNQEESRAMERKVTGTWFDDPAHFRKPTRRGFLYVGFAGGLGLTLDNLFRLEACADTKVGGKEAPARSLIHIFLPGGMAHQDSFDPKPYAPIEYRGEMGTVPTKVDGMLLNEFLKQ